MKNVIVNKVAYTLVRAKYLKNFSPPSQKFLRAPLLETADSFRKLVSKERFLKLKDFRLKMHLIFGNTCVCETAFHTMKQVKS